MVKITGSGGFVGKNVVLYLQAMGVSTNTITRSELYAIDDNLLKYTETVIHLAGKAHDLKGESEAHEYYKVNFEVTKKLYDAFLQSGAKKFIFISSVKAVEDSPVGSLIEEYAAHPRTHYGKSKRMAEEYILAQNLPENKSVFILRPCMIHGPGNKGNLNLLYQFVEKGIPYPLASFQNRRSFLSIDNLSFVINELVKKDLPSGIYNVADDEALSTNEVISILAASLGKEARFWFIPQKVIIFFAAIGNILKLPLTERLDKLTGNYVVSNEKIIKALGTQLPVKAKDGLLSTANSFKP